MIRVQKVLSLIILLVLLWGGMGCTVTNAPVIEIGNRAVVCVLVTIVDTANATTTTQYYFKNIIDEFTALTMTGLAPQLANVQTVTLTISFQNSAPTYDFILISSANSIQRHFLSFVINLNQGSLNSIVGDNFCDDGCKCFQAECFQDNAAGFGSVDPQLYVSWGGDDSNGKSLLSSARRLSRFNMYSVSGLSSSMKSSMGY